jgi:predicted alpha/beta superfamily hydrolase
MEDTQTAGNHAASGPQGAIRATSATGDLRIHEFESRIFRNRRYLRVWLPPEYDEDSSLDRHYPVFYLNDGQNRLNRLLLLPAWNGKSMRQPTD